MIFKNKKCALVCQIISKIITYYGQMSLFSFFYFTTANRCFDRKITFKISALYDHLYKLISIHLYFELGIIYDFKKKPL